MAVLPLQNLSGHPDEDYFADGLTEALIGELARLGGVRVISRTSTMHYRDSSKTLPEIARELGVDAVVEGSVIKAGDRVQIRTQLIRAKNDEHLWAETFERDIQDIPTLYNDIAQAVAWKIRVRISAAEKARLAVSRPVNRKAFEAYLRGRHYLNKRTEQSLRQAITFFRASLDEDAAYAPAYVGLADSYYQLGTVVIGAEPPVAVRPLAIAAALRALEIDGDLAEAHAVLGLASLYDWEWERAEKELRRAIELNPGYAPVRVWYSSLLIFRQKPLQALQEISVAQELDPLSAIVQTQAGWIHKFADRDEEAIIQYRRVLQMEPNFAWALFQVGQSCLNLGRFMDAVENLEKGVQVSGRSAAMVATLGEAYALAGRRARAEELLQELRERSQHRYVPPAVFVYLYLGLRDYDQAFRWLEQAYRERSNLIAGLAVWPSRRLYPDFCSDARFRNVLHRIGIAPRKSGE